MTECTHCRKRYENGVRFCPVDGYAVAPVAEPMLGRTLMGQFQIQSVCGHGATGTVYRATQVGIDREVAVKVLRADLLKDVDVIKRFVREARAGARLNHPNIATVHMVGQTEDGVPFLAMEFVEGVPLSALVGVGKALPLRRIVHIGAQIASALSEAHGQGIVHRDLKPENILLTERRGEADVVKVVDFGIAKMIAHAVPGEDPISRMGTVFGTPHYIAPEQAAGQPVDGRADIYSLGCILYQMATGRVPFDGQQGLQVLLRQVRDPVPDPRSVNPRISPALSDLILKMLAKEPAERPQSATLVAAALRELVSDAEPAAAQPPASSGPRAGAAREASRSGGPRDVPRSGSAAAAVESSRGPVSSASRDSSQDAGWYRDEDGPSADSDLESDPLQSRDEDEDERPRKRRRAELAPTASGGPSRQRSRHPSRSGRPAPARPDDSNDYVAPPPPSFLQRHWMPVVSIGSAVALGALAGLLYAHFHGAQLPPPPPVAPVVVAAPPAPATSLVRGPSRPPPSRPATPPAQPAKPGEPSLPVTVFPAGPPLSGPRPVAPGTPGPAPTVSMPAAPGTPPALVPSAPTVIAPPPATTVIAPPPATPPLVTLPTTTVTSPPAPPPTQPVAAPAPAPKPEEAPPPAPEKPPAPTPKPEEPEENNNDPYHRLK